MTDAEDCRQGLRFAAIVIVWAMAPTLAFAYIDPGNGAYMVQALFTLVGAAIFYLRHPVRSMKSAWHWSLGRFKRPLRPARGGEGGAELSGDADTTEAAPVSIQERS